jgi:hypothetical protein
MKNLRFLLSLCLLSSCAQVPDLIACRPTGPTSAFCTYTITDKDIIIDDTHLYNGKTWIDIKVESVYLPSESWIKIKEYIIKQCKKHNDCQNNIQNWDSKLSKLTP